MFTHACWNNYAWYLPEQKGSVFNYCIFKMLLKFMWPVPATGINYLWLSFFFSPCSSMMHAILAIIKLGSSVMFWICNRWWMYNQPRDGRHNSYVLAQMAICSSIKPPGMISSVIFQHTRCETAWLTVSSLVMRLAAPLWSADSIHIQIHTLISFVSNIWM